MEERERKDTNQGIRMSQDKKSTMVNGSAAKKGVEQGRSADLEQAILRALEKSSSGAGTFTGKGSGARRRAIRRFRNLTGHEGKVNSVMMLRSFKTMIRSFKTMLSLWAIPSK